jgi:ribonuclease J
MEMEKLKIVPLGGLGEIGKNMMILEYGSDIIVIDAGLMFPNEEMPGVDFIIPDISYLLQKRQKVRGIVITHGHEDHIGALPYVLGQLDVPVYATRFTHELITLKLKNRRVKTEPELRIVPSDGHISLGAFNIRFFSVCHSIPDAVGLVIETPLGIIVHSGDFKFDHTPVMGKVTDVGRLALAGNKGVLLLLSDSTYAELPGYGISEAVVSETLDNIVAGAKGRVIITTFASLVSRIQQVIDVAAKHDRRVAIIGRSMKELVKAAIATDYLHIPPDVLGNFEDLKSLPNNRVVFLTTGSQGEPTSALVRIANRDRRSQVHIIPGDTVVMSATPIPGNEMLVNRTIDALFHQGAKVIYGETARVHVHGHGSQEDLKLLLQLVKPKFFIPVHGEYRHLSLHAMLAQSVGIPEENIFVLEDGDILELHSNGGKVVGKAPVGGEICVDGSIVSRMDAGVLQERKLISQEGVVAVSAVIDSGNGQLMGKPLIKMKGFIASPENQHLVERGQDVLFAAMSDNKRVPTEAYLLDAQVKEVLSRFFYQEIHRRPAIILITTKV